MPSHSETTWTRRQFVSATALGILGAGVSARSAGGLRATASFRDLRRNVGIFSSQGGTIGWLVNGGGAIVVDSQYPATAADCLAGLRQRGAADIAALVNTHHHGDHTAGNGVFREAAGRIVAHVRAAELQRSVAAAAGEENVPVVADTTFDSEWRFDVGDEAVHAQHFGEAHTGGDCVVRFERANVIHMGDLVFHRAYPFIDVAGGASVRGWIALLETVAAGSDADTVFVFGHAAAGHDVTGSAADVLRQRDFLAAVLAAAERAHASGMDRTEATAITVLPGFEEYTALVPRLDLGSAIGAAYDEVQRAR